MKTLLWLDDIRNPFKEHQWHVNYVCSKCLDTNIRNVDIVWVKTQSEFENYIEKNGLPDLISFDNDLGIGNGEGYDCAKWLVEYCMDNNVQCLNWFVHSSNPVAKENIEKLLNNFKKAYEKNF